MSDNRIECPNCQEWNTSNHETTQRCGKCGQPLQDEHRLKRLNKPPEMSSIDTLPPYAKYIFLGLVGVIGTIVVLALA